MIWNECLNTPASWLIAMHIRNILEVWFRLLLSRLIRYLQYPQVRTQRTLANTAEVSHRLIVANCFGGLGRPDWKGMKGLLLIRCTQDDSLQEQNPSRLETNAQPLKISQTVAYLNLREICPHSTELLNASMKSDWEKNSKFQAMFKLSLFVPGFKSGHTTQPQNFIKDLLTSSWLV